MSLNQHGAQGSEEGLLGFDYLAATGDGEVVLYTDYGNKWRFGIVSAPGTPICSVYSQLSERGVDSVLYVTHPGIRGSFRFRPAAPHEYEGVRFSYGRRPRAVVN
jgi:hypothetical protein